MRSPTRIALLCLALPITLVATACGASRPTLTDAASTSTVGDIDDDLAITATVGDVLDARSATVRDTLDGARGGAAPLLGSSDAYVVRVIERRDHDITAFTQGLEFVDGRLFESRGQEGESALTEIDPVDGTVLRSAPLGDEYFGEGITAVGDRIIVLTWRNETAFVFDPDSLEVTSQIRYDGEGWGLCYDGVDLWMSNGSSVLTRRDPSTFDVVEQVEVFYQGTPISDLNELECLDGLVWANVLNSDTVVVIDPITGEVVARVDASALREEVGPADVLNGIAYDVDFDELILTGKDWPAMFVVGLEPCSSPCEMKPFPPVPDN